MFYFCFSEKSVAFFEMNWIIRVCENSQNRNFQGMFLP